LSRDDFANNDAGSFRRARRNRNLARRVHIECPPTVVTNHASQRRKERGPNIVPVFADQKRVEKRMVVVTYLPVDLQKDYRSAKRAHQLLLQEVEWKGRLTRNARLPVKPSLSPTHARILKISKDAVKKEYQRRRVQKRTRAYLRAGTAPMAAL
jgi:hypothetical protein